jgi:hypothetical protein
MSGHPHPSFDRLVQEYPSPSKWGPGSVKRLIGGGADDTRATTPAGQWLGGENGDTCALRMSRALNLADIHLPSHFHGMRTVTGGDGFSYAFAVEELHTWLKFWFGPPDIMVKGKPVKRDAFSGKKGIILFDIVFGLNDDGRTRALGHADLWDGETFFNEIEGHSVRNDPARDYFSRADAVSLWICQGTTMLPRS